MKVFRVTRTIVYEGDEEWLARTLGRRVRTLDKELGGVGRRIYEVSCSEPVLLGAVMGEGA